MRGRAPARRRDGGAWAGAALGRAASIAMVSISIGSIVSSTCVLFYMWVFVFAFTPLYLFYFILLVLKVIA